MILQALRRGACLVPAGFTLLTGVAHESSELYCAKTHAFLAPLDSADHRKYAPDREMDILHLALEVTPDFQKRTVSGQATLTFKPIAKPLPELRLDAVDLTVASVTATEQIHSFQITDRQLIVTFDQPIAADRETTVTIQYSAQPRQGLYFRTPEMGYREGDTHLFTQGEPIEARHWYPCYDAPNEKFTSEVTCHVPEGMTVLSNGRRVSEQRDPQTGLRAVRWVQEKPHVNYLISLVAGYFKTIEDHYNDLPMAFHTPPSEITEAANSFRGAKEMMAYFEEEIGVPYPWNKYDQVVVHDFVAGGMENTSITTLTHLTLFTSATENIRSSEGLVAHELAHQWFGNLVTCKDWSHLWLNEGFATYYAHLYAGHKHGRDQLLYGLYNSAKGFIDRPGDTNPIVYRKYDSPTQQFSYLAYPKGSWVLHMLRSQLGEDLYRRCIKTFLERHQYGTVVTQDLNAVIEELSGRSYDQFFDQWVYHAHHPELDITYRWDARTKLAKVSIAQTQKLSDAVLLFKFPLTIRFRTRAETFDRHITVQQKAEDFYFALPEAPQLVRIDPEFTLLAKIKFNPPDALLSAQLADPGDVIGRLLAVEQLSTRKDHATVNKLKQALNNDNFHGVRIEAAKALRAVHSDEALAALIDSQEQADARVRQQVVIAISGFYREDAFQAVRRVLGREKNPDIVSPAIRALAPYAREEVREDLLRYLNSESYRNTLAEAAIDAMRSQDDPVYIAPLQRSLQERQAAFTSRGLARGLQALAHLARNEETKQSVLDFLVAFTNSKQRTVRTAAISALGTLADPKALPVVETFAGASKETPERGAAERAMAALREARKPAEELKELRNEVLELQKQNRDLRREFDDLKKKMEAKGDPATPKEAPAPSQ